MRAAAMLVVAAVVLGGCAGGHDTAVRPAVSYRLPRPPAQSTWPPYPTFNSHSCWVRGGESEGSVAFAPSFAPPSTRLTPRAVADRILRRLGDRRYVTRIALGRVSPRKLLHVKGYFGGRRPPPDAIWAWIGTRGMTRATRGVAAWEAQLVGGALRDGLCAAAGSPLVGWTVPGADEGGFSDAAYPYGQRFPNPTPAAFRRAVRAAGKAYGFTPIEVRLLHPLGRAPLVVVRTDRPRKEFYDDLAAIEALLNPRHGTAATFEGFYFEARDSKGAFIRGGGAERGTAEGMSWLWDRCLYPEQPISSPCK